ncbi:hypothetical protein PPSIR1_03178 [Plesiocystis pacifica SIR-1]|uniref:Uncharacterized protein n=1 Tax=Plesiocystis pacifica SIR-1 TaxID=391625 RepID=A6GJE1_9BACT|nr:hypothetical protein PPSIR1_03178 [Plesiocystis pacifica SIR-1]
MMAVPRPRDSYDSFAEQQAFVRARLGADPETASLAPRIHQLLESVDAGNQALRRARALEQRGRGPRRSLAADEFGLAAGRLGALFSSAQARLERQHPDAVELLEDLGAVVQGLEQGVLELSAELRERRR